MTQQEANELIAEKLKDIAKLYQECAEIADNAGVNFSYEGPEGYFDGGDYYADVGYSPNDWSSSSC